MEDDIEGNFDALVADLNLLAKAQPKKTEDAAGDKKIAAAAADADGDGKADHAEPDGDEGADGDDAEMPLGKAFKVVVDGEEVDAYDGRDALLALSKSLGTARDVALEATKRTDVLAKALAGAGRLISGLEQRLAAQDDLIKALRADVERVGGQPAGRKAVLNVHDKPGATDAAPPAAAPREVLAKALAANKAGRISAVDVATIEASLARRLTIPPDLLARVGA